VKHTLLSRVFFIVACIVAFSGSAFADGSLSILGGGQKGWDGWTSTGTAWRQTGSERGENPASSAPHMESAEDGTGTLRSPAFTVDGDVIEFWANGWDGKEGFRRTNKFVLRLAKDDSIVRQSAPPLQDSFTRVSWLVSDLKGRQVYFEAIDGISGAGFAWIGLAQVVEKRMAVPAESSEYRAIPLASTGIWSIMTATGGFYNKEPYLSSIAQGESGTGEIASPAFTLSVPRIRIKARGWDGRNGEVGKNLFLLEDASTGQVLRKSEPPLGDEPQWIEWNTADLKGRSVRIRLVDSNSDTSFAWMGIDEVDAGQDYRVDFSKARSLAGWQPKVSEPEYCEIGGIPFLPSSGSAAVTDGTAEISVGCKAKHMFLLGMTSSRDQGNLCWFSPMDYAVRFFVGDSMGEIKVVYADGSADQYPLVLGESLWWGMRFTRYPEPFASQPEAAKALKDSLRLYPAKPTPDGRYLAVVTPKAQSIKAIEIVDSPSKAGVPVVLGLTVEPMPGEKVPNGVALSHDAMPADLAAFVQQSPLRKAGANEKAAEQRLAALREALYTTRSNFPKHVALTVPAGYRGPTFKFEGDSYAEVLNNILYANIQDISERVDAEGMYHTSAKGAPSWGGYEGFGTYRDGVGSYYTQSWTRDMGRSLGELCSLGYLDEGKRCADYVFKQARIWEERADLKINGVVLPRHICRVLQGASIEPGQGCFENDGQGLTALFVYNLWRRLPDRDLWLMARWKDVFALGDWIVWQFEHPEISGAKEVLRTDSECAGGTGYSVYADMACIETLRALADMAESIGNTDKAAQWRGRADKMTKGCESTYIVNDSKYGKTWTLDHSGWPNRSTVMGPIIIPPDRTGFLGLKNDPWRAYNEATYKRQIEACKPFGYFGVAMGYGQGFVTQSALLLDRMSDATEMLRWAARQTYSAAFKSYIVPEGCEVDPTGSFWHRTGDLGNGVQQAEIVKALRVVIGVDDSTPKQLRICPRMPFGWTAIHVSKFPVMIERNGRTETAHIGYELKSTGGQMRIQMTSDKPLPAVELRLGPFKTAPGGPGVERSGDSYWVTTALPAGRAEFDAVTPSR
jgi:hypothetical protein